MTTPIIHPAGYTMRQAAELAGVSTDTIKRDLRQGRYPHAAMVGGAWHVPIADLVSAGRVDASLAGADETDAFRGHRAIAELAEARSEMQSLKSRCTVAEASVVRLEEERQALRRTVDRLLDLVGGA